MSPEGYLFQSNRPGGTTVSTQPSHSDDRPAAPGHPPSTGAATADGPDPGRQPVPPPGSDPAIIASAPPEILEAQRTFLAELPQLLRERPGQWVAYHGSRRLGFGKTKTALCDDCIRQGYEEFLIRRIRPRSETDYISAL